MKEKKIRHKKLYGLKKEGNIFYLKTDKDIVLDEDFIVGFLKMAGLPESYAFYIYSFFAEGRDVQIKNMTDTFHSFYHKKANILITFGKKNLHLVISVPKKSRKKISGAITKHFRVVKWKK